MTEMLMVFVTCDARDQAETIAGKVVGEGIAACVNILPGIRSCYMWEGKLTWSEELLLVMKTTAARFEDLKKRVLELHSYQVPEIVGVGIDVGLEEYLEWMRSSVRQG